MLPFNRKLGKLPYRHDPRTLRAAHFVDRSALPTPPIRCNYVKNIRGPLGMLGNDQYGCCGFAAYAHILMTVMATAGRPFQITAEQCIREYLEFTGGADTGVNLLEMLKHAKKNGIFGHKLAAYFLIEPHDHRISQIVTEVYGGNLVGVELPDSAMQSDQWIVADKPNPDNGHAIMTGDYDQVTGLEPMVSWGMEIPTTYAWTDACADERWGLVFEEFTLAGTGKSVAGFDERAMLDMSQRLAT